MKRKLSIDGLRSYLKEYLVDYMIPSVIVLLEQLPLNANGKVDIKALFWSRILRMRNVQIGMWRRTETEEKIAAIWADVLALDKVGIHDNFFQLGGHSLLAMTLIERIRRQGFHADVRSLFITQTLAEFVAILDQNCAVEVPDNQIPSGCQRITPAMLPLVSLQQTEIDSIIQRVPGGTRNVQDIYSLTPFQKVFFSPFN